MRLGAFPVEPRLVAAAEYLERTRLARDVGTRGPRGSHLVSRDFAKRFFFEVVERRGYRAYGAANAAIRLAAQSRYRDDLDQ
jgi:4-hydroxyphenylpyruvate dioxygenase-like putative hemolysin